MYLYARLIFFFVLRWVREYISFLCMEKSYLLLHVVNIVVDQVELRALPVWQGRAAVVRRGVE